MILLFIIAGYAFIGFFVGRDLLAVHRRCRVEFRQCFGKRKIYLRERKTGRLIGCSNNPFTLICRLPNMPFIRCFVALVMILFAFAVIYNLPYSYLSPRWFFTAAGVAFITAAFVGFILPTNKKGG